MGSSPPARNAGRSTASARGSSARTPAACLERSGARPSRHDCLLIPRDGRWRVRVLRPERFEMIWIWLGFIVFILLLLALDLGVFHRKAHVVSVKEALGWSA